MHAASGERPSLSGGCSRPGAKKREGQAVYNKITLGTHVTSSPGLPHVCERSKNEATLLGGSQLMEMKS